MNLLEWISLVVGVIGILTGISAVAFFFFKTNSNCDEIKRMRDVKFPDVYSEIEKIKLECTNLLNNGIKDINTKLTRISAEVKALNDVVNTRELEYKELFYNLKTTFAESFKDALKEVVTEVKDYVNKEISHVQKQVDDIKLIKTKRI